ncbi:MAG: hypothetical protein ACK4PC_08905 [Sphingopyxis sp.]
MRTMLAAAMIPLLCACPGRVVVRDRVQSVSVPVAVKCASEKPAEVPPLREQIAEADWAALTLKQKSERTAAQALRRLGYSEALRAATAAC